MKFISRLLNKDWRREHQECLSDGFSRVYTSVVWSSSKTIQGVKYAVRRASLGQRIELVKKTRDLALQNEFLRAGDAPDQMCAALADLYVQRLYLEWGFVEMKGFTIDGQMPTIPLLIEKGPEALCAEIVEAIQQEMSFNEDERKNS